MDQAWDTLPLFKRLNWLNTVFLIGTPLAAAMLVPWYFSDHGMTWLAALLFVGYSMCTSLSITAGYHRMLSHRSYEAKPLVKLMYLLFGAAAFQGSALQWCTDHRRHHAFVDTEKDPHNINRGFFYAHVGWLFYRAHPRYDGQFLPDLSRDPLVRRQHRHYLAISTFMGFGFPTLIGWAFGSALTGFIFGGMVRVVFTMHCTFLINSLAHTLGRRPYNDRQTARDSLLMALLAYGEGYHNFHHQFAADYRNGIRWYHWDPTKWAIWLMSVPGLTYKLKCASITDILRARLRTDEKHLLQSGLFSAERVAAMKNKVEEAQIQWKALREEYRKLKVNMRHQSRETLLRLKAELRVARLEFKMAWAQWLAYRKTLRGVPVRAA